MKEQLKASGKYVVIAIMVIVVYFIFKPTAKPTTPTPSKGGGVTTPDFGGNDKDYTPEVNEDLHEYLSDVQIKKIDEERKKAGAWGSKEIDWGDYASNADKQIGPKSDRWKTTAIFKGINVHPTGGGCWPGRLKEIINFIKSREPDLPKHWDIGPGYILDKK